MKAKKNLMVISVVAFIAVLVCTNLFFVKGQSPEFSPSTKEIFNLKWNEDNSIGYKDDVRGRYSFSDYQILENDRIAFLYLVSREVRIYNISSKDLVQKIPLQFVPDQFYIDKNNIYLLVNHKIFVIDFNGNVKRDISFDESIDFISAIKIIDGEIFLLTANEKTYIVNDNETKLVKDEWLFDKNFSGKTIKQNDFSFELNFTLNKSKENYNILLKEKIGSIIIIGYDENNIYLLLEQLVNNSPILVENHLLLYSLAENKIIENKKLPEGSFIYLDSPFKFNEKKLFHLLTTTGGISLYELNFNKKQGSFYNKDLFKKSFQLLKDALSKETSTKQGLNIRNESLITCITGEEILLNADTFLNYTWIASSCNITPIGGSACGSNAQNVQTPLWINQPGSYTAIPYCWGGGSTLAQFGMGLANCASAGDQNTTTPGYAGSNCSVGVDCSGLVTRALNRN